ncbi:MAG TPA: hypothetical protein VHZ30_04185, partial [Verrucomicrobiae bacterium]|nr:hypothetical protein [Verrucomicrobiae bacterium]
MPVSDTTVQDVETAGITTRGRASENIPGKASAPSLPRSVGLPQRLMSLDALRGFDMFWIIGADDLVIALNKMTHPNGHATGG